MYVIVVYDIDVERLNKVRAILRRYLFWVQNSVFEGEISESSLAALKKQLKDVMDKSYDSVIFYRFSSQKAVIRDVLGIDPGMRDFLL